MHVPPCPPEVWAGFRPHPDQHLLQNLSRVCSGKMPLRHPISCTLALPSSGSCSGSLCSQCGHRGTCRAGLCLALVGNTSGKPPQFCMLCTCIYTREQISMSLPTPWSCSGKHTGSEGIQELNPRTPCPSLWGHLLGHSRREDDTA